MSATEEFDPTLGPFEERQAPADESLSGVRVVEAVDGWFVFIPKPGRVLIRYWEVVERFRILGVEGQTTREYYDAYEYTDVGELLVSGQIREMLYQLNEAGVLAEVLAEMREEYEAASAKLDANRESLEKKYERVLTMKEKKERGT